MRIAIIGVGYVGLVTGVCFAELGHRVVCIDRDENKIKLLSAGRPAIHEPDLEEYMLRLMGEERLRFSASVDETAQADVVVVAVGTPQRIDGASDLTDLESAVRRLAPFLREDTIVMIKSTVPVGTNERVRDWIREETGRHADTVSVPEFMREGSALQDSFHPDRIVIGSDSPRAAAIAGGLHAPLTANILHTDLRTAEMIKYASNAFLATKISFINEMANLCDKVGADVEVVAAGMGMDPRIGSAFLKAGIGYGGSCFPKDTHALLQIAGHVDYDFKLLKAVIEVNQTQRRWVLDALNEQLGTIEGLTIAVWGASFKPGTDDVRSAPSLDIVPELVSRGAAVRMCDPAGESNFRRAYEHPQVTWYNEALAAAEGAHAVCLLTEWPVFREVDLSLLRSVMAAPVLIDGRNAYQGEAVMQAGLYYTAVGRPVLRQMAPCSLD
ncbi:UDP-glucose dehydrogenase family protein [Paenibacillus tarimensis]|uniref:UDP-glucose dehydrogenase family protein n=1 Tax=Paenibacillus tarimensis TaxID=416012 RepID=UPI001F237200|nr:UDP-glucose/GDP-mannose dehydrogenase family protein [Paenibacillus tarimensis]MCF2944962.1 UDP-glucose/GDP-mannose dehydrogenase family protein [Paenibacillus tarimensis]